jgi:hypothetical protein
MPIEQATSEASASIDRRAPNARQRNERSA